MDKHEEMLINDLDLSIKEGDVRKLTPIEYAKYASRKLEKKISPQKIYYLIRNGKLVRDWCECGRKVIVIEEANALLGIEEKYLEADKIQMLLDDDEPDDRYTSDPSYRSYSPDDNPFYDEGEDADAQM